MEAHPGVALSCVLILGQSAPKREPLYSLCGTESQLGTKSALCSQFSGKMEFALGKKVTAVCEGSKGTSCMMSGEGDRPHLTAVTSEDSEGEERPRSRPVRSSHPECGRS